MSTPDSRRARWRADLLDYGAALQASVGLDGPAASATAKAAVNREMADLADELAEAKATGTDLAAVKRRVHERRSQLRGGRGLGNETVDNFAEPTDAQLIEMGF